MDLQNLEMAKEKIIRFPISTDEYDKNRNKLVFDGPLSGPMWEKVSSLKSKYPDTFDWSIYDKLFERFGGKQPRGGVTFKTTFKLVNHHTSCSKCHYAFEIDTYGRGCAHNCAYCYAKDQLTAHGYWNRPMPFPLDLTDVRKTFYTVFETSRPHKWRSILEKRVPLRIGSMSDSFMWMDAKYGITREFLQILSFYNYPYIIFTRSDLVAHDDYLSVLRKDLASIQMSISGSNETLTRYIEPGAPSVERRLLALQKLSKHSFWTTVRINPLFPCYPDGYFTERDSTLKKFKGEVPKFNLLDMDSPDGFIEAIKQAGVPSILAGFVRLSPMAINSISKVSGVNLNQFFLESFSQGRSDRRFTDIEIAFYYKTLKAACDRQGVRFSTCYIGNGIKDYFQYQKMWSNKKDCCDARGNVKGFGSSSQEIDWKTRTKFAPDQKEAEKSRATELSWDAKDNVGLRTDLRIVATTSRERTVDA